MLIKKQKNNNQSGIALITTIVLTSIMLTSVVLLSREMVDEVQSSTRIDNSLIAYYAAEAGLEEALLEWRYDHNAEISQENDNDSSVNVTIDSNNTPRTVDLTNNQRIPKSKLKEYTRSYFELLMWNKSPQILNQKILKDDVYQFEVENVGSENIVLKFQPNPENPIGSNNGYRIEMIVVDGRGESIDAARKFTCPNELTTRQFVFTPSNLANADGSLGRRIFRIRPWYTKYEINCATTPPIGAIGLNSDGSIPGASTENKYPYVILNVNQTATGQLIVNPIANIESVGYYGGVARKITATLDRSSGNILGINDFVIYSGSDEGLIK